MGLSREDGSVELSLHFESGCTSYELSKEAPRKILLLIWSQMAGKSLAEMSLTPRKKETETKVHIERMSTASGISDW